LVAQVSEMRETISGVSLDEEMANLISLQHAYSAAAKLMATADEMIQELLELK
jgi:flagellar hook-associated protein 1 FlgK